MSSLEERFLSKWKSLQSVWPDPEREVMLFKPRRWRYDFVWADQMVIVEMEGGVWSAGRHLRPSGFIADVEKYNAAAVGGWVLLRYTVDDITKRSASMLGQIVAALAKQDPLPAIEFHR